MPPPAISFLLSPDLGTIPGVQASSCGAGGRVHLADRFAGSQDRHAAWSVALERRCFLDYHTPIQAVKIQPRPTRQGFLFAAEAVKLSIKSIESRE